MNLDMLILLYAASVLAGVVLYVPALWRLSAYRRSLAGLLAITSGLMIGSALFLGPPSLLLPLAFIQIYVALNMFRIVENRMNEHYAYRATVQTFARITSLQLTYYLVWRMSSQLDASIAIFTLLLVLFMVPCTLYFILSARTKRSSFDYKGDGFHNAAPTVTVAIPARNETKDLHDCLVSLLKTNYPKLEILVLDDCSQGPRTSEIIRSFAHEGVRFIQGAPVQDYWLAKNQAYDMLADHASGEIILFCGVDIRFEPQTIQQLVNQLVITEKRMLSCMPVRADATTRRWAPAQFNRYFHELVYPYFIFRRPPVLSTCFMIYRNDIAQFGGFEAVRRAINPEGYFAKQLATTNQYSFLRGTSRLGLSSVKTAREQQETAVRTLYPQLRKQPEQVLYLTLIGAVAVYGPMASICLAIMQKIPPAIGLATFAILVIWLMIYLQVIRATQVHTGIWALLSAPVVALYDLVLLHISMIKYEFSEVIWKNRNVCEPVMHVLPHLPPLDTANQGVERR